MGQFNVGDKVRIKPLRYDMPFSKNSRMDSLEGEVFTIVNIVEGMYNKNNCPNYICDECKYMLSDIASDWSWSNPMLELVEKPKDWKELFGASIPTKKGEPLRLAVKHYTIKLNFKN